ncbi:MAG: EscU/YscU/HrcU family type III secretion system export apparatus switch protein, partial [Exilibacterium sp.]
MAKLIIRRATPQWFIAMDSSGLRQTALNAIEDTLWFPPKSKGRITDMAQQLATMMDQSFEYELGGSGDIYWLLQRVILIAGAITLPLFIALIIAGIAGSAAQNTPRFVGERVKPQLSRISLIKGWERIFSVKGFAEFIKATAKLVFATALVVVILHDLVPRMMQGMNTEIGGFLVVVKEMLLKLFAAIIFA